jgi:hypothetical protein
MADYCTRCGYDLQGIVETVWGAVSRRDWSANKATGASA